MSDLKIKVKHAIDALNRMVQVRKKCGLSTMQDWTSGESVFHWWCEPDFNPDQLTLF